MGSGGHRGSGWEQVLNKYIFFRFHNVQYHFHFFVSSHFGFFAPGEIDVVQSLQETELYQEDFIGNFWSSDTFIDQE